MPIAQARQVLQQELGGAAVEDVFEWIDLEQPLGSASVAQVLRQGCITCNTCTNCESRPNLQCVHLEQPLGSASPC